MLVEVGHDPADRAVDEPLLVDLVDVLAPDAIDYLGDPRGGFDRGVRGDDARLRMRREGRPDRRAEGQAEAEHHT